MATKSRIWMVLVGVLGCVFLFAFPAQPAGEQQLGRIVYSNATSLRGVAVPNSETILSGDVLATSDNGNALVELKSGAKLKITRSSSLRFLGDGDKVQAELLAGEVVSESAGKPALVVTTSKFQFAPSQEGDCRFAVALGKQQETVAGALKGNLLVRTHDSLGSYILPEGKYAAIPAWSAAVPSQETAGGAPAPAGQAGTIMNAIPEEVLQRQGQGAEIALNLSDGVNQGDVVRTSSSGRVRIGLVDGSFLNLGSRSTLSILKQDAQTQQTLVELIQGYLRAEVVKPTNPAGRFQVQTPTAIIGVVGSLVFVHALPGLTQVHCVEGLCSVQNIDSGIAGQVTLHAGESTRVSRRQAPTAPVQSSPEQLQSQINQTTMSPSSVATAGPGGQAGAAQGGWHIGSLSESSSILVVAGIGAGAAGAVISLAASGKSSSSGSVSPSAP
ncbi:MAG: FecR family protein [Terriglobia bacterium]